MGYQHFASWTKRGDVAVITVDQQGEKINKISPDVIRAFDELFREIDQDSSVKAAVMISAKKDFIAGADIDMFARVKKKGDFEPITREGHAALARMEASKKPIVAAIHGACLGAGTEIALACHARIAAQDSSTHLALPEMMLGLLPGGGGTQRLPRLIGMQRSLDILLTGKKVYAKSALKLGLVDRLTTRESLLDGAVAFARELVNKPIQRQDRRTFVERLLESNSFTRGIVLKKAREMVMAKTLGNYPAPLRILECVEIGLNHGMKAGLDAEALKFEELILTDVSRQLIRIFFNMTEKKKNPYAPELIKEVKTLGMIGAGFMGAGIAEVSAKEGIRVLLKDIKEETLAQAKKTIWKGFEKKLKKGLIPQAEAEAVINRVQTQTDYAHFDQAEVVIEAVFEEIKIKQKVVKETEAAVKPGTIFASNTSALPIGQIAAAAAHPELVIGMHYFSPVPKMPLLEIVKTPQTAPWVTATCYELGARQGKTVIVVNDGPGFYTTRILAPYFNEAMLLLEEGADARLLDKCMKQYGFPVGPITLLDEVGLDVGAHVMSGELIEYYLQREGARASDAVMKLYKAGYHGKKNKKGFYKYDEKGKKQGIDDSVYGLIGGASRKEFSAEVIMNRMGMSMINEAILCLQEAVLESALDGDIGAIFGLGFPPFKGGPFRYCDQLGLRQTVELMNDLAARYGARFKPAALLLDKADKGESFYMD
jgi:3-hydroxyacyl-CoA dehydrogenase/enoyl-CoA hydratase/3-hydroxybutyryl-CoA epimerase